MQKYLSTIVVSMVLLGAANMFAVAQVSLTAGEQQRYRELQSTAPDKAEEYKATREQVYYCKNPPGGQVTEIPILRYKPEHLSDEEKKYVNDCLINRLMKRNPSLFRS